MTDIATLIADMVRAGVDPDLIGRTAAAFAARSTVPVVDVQAERRRAADRDRKRAGRLRNSAESAEFAETPPPPPQAKASPQTPLENSTPPPRSVPTGPHCPPDGVGDGRARAPTSDDADDLVAVVAAILPEFHPLLGDVMARSVALGWLRSGYDPQLDVLPAVARALEGEFPTKRWKGLTGWVENAHRDRLAAEQARGPPEIIPPARPAPRSSRPRHDHVSTVEIGRALAANPPPGYS